MVCCDYVISFASHIGSCVVCVYLSLYLSVSDVHTDVYKHWLVLTNIKILGSGKFVVTTEMISL